MTTDEIKSRNPLPAILSAAGVALLPKNGALQALCPFHSEKSPSFYAYPNQRYKCYGCGEAGDVIAFIQRTRNVTFRAACDLLSGAPMSDVPILIKAEPKIVEPISEAVESHHMKLFREQEGTESYAAAAKALGVSVESFRAVLAAWSEKQRAWMFPLRRSDGKIIGFRFRDTRGNKWSMAGGHSGLIMPRNKIGEELWLCEGPTDLLALLTLGITSAVARPSAFGGIQMAIDFAKRMNVGRVVICADADRKLNEKTGEIENVGLAGAMKLARLIGIPARLWQPPEGSKDVRAALIGGMAFDKLISGISEISP